MAENYEKFQTAKAARIRSESDRGGRGRGRGRGGGRGRGRGRGGGSARPPAWTPKQKEDQAKNRKKQIDSKILFAAFKDAQDNKPAAREQKPTEREQQLTEFARQFDPTEFEHTEVLAVTGNASYYTALPERLKKS